MSITLSRKAIAVAVTAGLVTVGAATTISYAAGSSATVTACVTKKNVVGGASSKGKCAKGFTKVSIAKQGPRGPQGAAGKQGVQGAQGAQGPGAVAYAPIFLFSDIRTKTIDGINYTINCDVEGTGSSRTVTTTLAIAQPGVSSTTLDGVQFSGADNNQVGSVVRSTSSVASTQVFANGGQASTGRLTSAIVESGKKTHLVTARLYANPAEGGGILLPIRCDADLVVTPTS